MAATKLWPQGLPLGGLADSLLDRPGPLAGVQVCSKNSSFLLENSIFWAQAVPAAQPGVQDCSKITHFDLHFTTFNTLGTANTL